MCPPIIVDSSDSLCMFQVAIPIEDVNRSHLRFTFRHRSSQDCKSATVRECYATLLIRDVSTGARSLFVVWRPDRIVMAFGGHFAAGGSGLWSDFVRRRR